MRKAKVKVKNYRYLVWDVQRGNWKEVYGEDYQSAFRLLAEVVSPDYKNLGLCGIRGIKVWYGNDKSNTTSPLSLIEEDKNGRVRKQLRGNLLFSKAGKEFLIPLSDNDVDNIKSKMQFELIHDEALARLSLILYTSASQTSI